MEIDIDIIEIIEIQRLKWTNIESRWKDQNRYSTGFLSTENKRKDRRDDNINKKTKMIWIYTKNNGLKMAEMDFSMDFCQQKKM